MNEVRPGGRSEIIAIKMFMASPALHLGCTVIAKC